MPTIITSDVQFKSGYKARIFLVPVTVTNGGACGWKQDGQRIDFDDYGSVGGE